MRKKEDQVDNKRYNVAIVGCGSMGVQNLFEKDIVFTYSFAGAVFKNPRTKLVALVDTDSRKLNDVYQRLIEEKYPTPLLCATTSFDDAAKECARKGFPVDIVCVAAGPQVNADTIRKATSLGIKGVYCEKPMTLSLAEADELAKIESKSGLKIQVNYLRNFDTHHLAVLDFIRDGGLGDLLIARVLYKGGVLAVAPHAFALLNLLFRKPTAVFGVYSPLFNTRCLDDPNIDGVVEYDFQGRQVNVSVTATGRGELENNTYLFEFEFTGTDGRITILGNGWRVRYEEMRPNRSTGSGTLHPYETARVPFELKADAPREFMIEGMQRLIHAIENDAPTTCGASTARDAEEVAHALDISVAEGGAVELPLTDRTHAFKNAVAGVKVLKKEAGR